MWDVKLKCFPKLMLKLKLFLIMNKTKTTFGLLFFVRYWNCPSWSCWDWHTEAWYDRHLCPTQPVHWGEIFGDAPWGPFWSSTWWQYWLQCKECLSEGTQKRICGWWQQKWSSTRNWKFHFPGVYWKIVKIEQKNVFSTLTVNCPLLMFILSNFFFFQVLFKRFNYPKERNVHMIRS